MKLKRLDVPSHWCWDLDDAFAREPTVGRPGWYGDRLTRTSWVELDNGSCFWEKWLTFAYSLKLAMHQDLHPREREAILELQRIGSCPRALSELLNTDREKQQIRDTGRDARLFFLKKG